MRPLASKATEIQPQGRNRLAAWREMRSRGLASIAGRTERCGHRRRGISNEAAIGCVTCKQRGIGGQAVDRVRILPDDCDAHSLDRTRPRRKGEEQAVAIVAESLRFDWLAKSIAQD